MFFFNRQCFFEEGFYFAVDSVARMLQGLNKQEGVNGSKGKEKRQRNKTNVRASTVEFPGFFEHCLLLQEENEERGKEI